jgi:hypothetical protein
MAVAAVSALLASIAIHVQNELSELMVGAQRPPRPASLDGPTSPDEAERLRLVNLELHGRCDVASVLERSPTIWVAKCRSGARVVLFFQPDGRLEQAADFVALTSSTSASDERVRQRFFDELLGTRCGVISTRMDRPNLWTALCRNGRRYGLWSKDGDLKVVWEHR